MPDKIVEAKRETAKEMCDIFDESACIKNDKWYLDLKEKFQGDN